MDVTCREIRKMDFDRGKRSEIQQWSNFANQLICTAVRAIGRQHEQQAATNNNEAVVVVVDKNNSTSILC